MAMLGFFILLIGGTLLTIYSGFIMLAINALSNKFSFGSLFFMLVGIWMVYSAISNAPFELIVKS
jgi:hypothetical protein